MKVVVAILIVLVSGGAIWLTRSWKKRRDLRELAKQDLGEAIFAYLKLVGGAYRVDIARYLRQEDWKVGFALIEDKRRRFSKGYYRRDGATYEYWRAREEE